MSMVNPAYQDIGAKRQRLSENEDHDTTRGENDRRLDELHPPTSKAPSDAASYSVFRNVSACNRCRVRKNRCDAQLPRCGACKKADTRCVGFDPMTKREIPRSYVFFLENRLTQLEALLKQNKIDVPAAHIGGDEPEHSREEARSNDKDDAETSEAQKSDIQITETSETLNQLVSEIGMVSVQGMSDPRSLSSSSGISFARVVFTAVKSSVARPSSENGATGNNDDSVDMHTAYKGSPGVVTNSTARLTESFFGLPNYSTTKPAPFPTVQLGRKLAELYFDYVNIKLPILQQSQFMDMFDQTYAIDERSRSARELYVLNMVFAIGAGVHLGSAGGHATFTSKDTYGVDAQDCMASSEEYHAAAAAHLEESLSDAGQTGQGTVHLQSVLLLASYALLRPVRPGLWYIIGVAARLALDMGLYREEHRLQNTSPNDHGGVAHPQQSKAELQRRLWWCAYSLDCQACIAVDRPLIMPDYCTTTLLPNAVPFATQIATDASSTYETFSARVFRHWIEMRILQSEMLRVLQNWQARHSIQGWDDLAEPKLSGSYFSTITETQTSFAAWRKSMSDRLGLWRDRIPSGASLPSSDRSFQSQQFELEYWQSIVLLFRRSDLFGDTVQSLTPDISPDQSRDIDYSLLRTGEAAQKCVRIYRQLHRLGLVNYTYLATHQIFLCGIAFLYAVWYSVAMCKTMTLDDFDLTILAATSVLGDLVEKCPSAEACLEALQRMAKTTLQMALQTPGRFLWAMMDDRKSAGEVTHNSAAEVTPLHTRSLEEPSVLRRRPSPNFDMDLKDLFPDGIDVSPTSSRLTTTALLRADQVQASQATSGTQDTAGADPVAWLDPGTEQILEDPTVDDFSLRDSGFDLDSFFFGPN